MKSSVHGKATAASSGLAQGHVQKLAMGGLVIPEKRVAASQLPKEIKRFENAVAMAMNDLQQEYTHVQDYHDISPVINAHLMLISDKTFHGSVVQQIQQQGINAEWALQLQIEEISQTFKSLDDFYLREKSKDIEQIGARIMQCLCGDKALEHVAINPNTILLAEDISPADVIRLWRAGVVGLVSRQGGMNAHAVIVARGIGLPMLIGVAELFEQANDGDSFILDASNQQWILHPSERECLQYQQKSQAQREDESGLLAFVQKQACSHDGRHLPLMANLEFVEEVDMACSLGVDGIGLFRTEFMFFQAGRCLNEDEQYQSYQYVVQSMQGKPTTFRLLDMGADKPDVFGHTTIRGGDNPALGVRGIRLLLQHPECLKQQLRALLRAAEFGPVNILIPMVTQCDEVMQVRHVLEKERKTFSHDTHVSLGTMIEVPASVLIAEELARVSDFFSIGTNDLIQYTLAADRSDESVSIIYTPEHPAIRKMIQMTVDAAQQAHIPISVCGELAASSQWTETFLKMGMDSLSMSLSHVLNVKRELSKIHYH